MRPTIDSRLEPFVAKVAPPGSDLYYALLFTRAPQRRAQAALYALEHEIADCTGSPLTLDAGRFKLQWWREEIDRLLAGQPRHPVTEALAASPVSPDALHLHALLNMAVEELSRPGLANLSQLTAHCAQQAAALYTALGALDGKPSAQLLETGGLLKLVQVLQSCAHGHPESSQDAAGASATAPSLSTLIAKTHERLQRHYMLAKSGGNPMPASVQIHCSLALVWLARAKTGFARTGKLQAHVSPLRKLMVAWRAARGSL